MYLVSIIIINFKEGTKGHFQNWDCRDLKSPELELELKSLELELELELKLFVSSGIGIGIGIENNGIGIGIELKKWNWPQPWSHHHLIFIMEMSILLRQHLYHMTAPGGTPKNFWGGCAAPVFDRIPLAKEILVENIPLTKENFLIMSPFLHDFKEFQHKYSLFKINFPKTDYFSPKMPFF